VIGYQRLGSALALDGHDKSSKKGDIAKKNSQFDSKKKKKKRAVEGGKKNRRQSTKTVVDTFIGLYVNIKGRKCACAAAHASFSFPSKKPIFSLIFLIFALFFFSLEALSIGKK
jgi:hypothetical protein